MSRLRIYARRMFHVVSSSGGDTVLFGVSLPSDTILNSIQAKIQLVGQTQQLAQESCLVYALEGWVVPVNDPDTALTLETLWDQQVPKDSDVQTLDLDTSAAVTDEFFNPGEADWQFLFQVGQRPRRIYHRHRMLSYQNAMHRFQDIETPFANVWNAGDAININIRRRMKVSRPSAVIFALAGTSVDDTVNTKESVLLEAEWSQVKFMREAIRMGLMSAIGLTEAGAETPWVDSLAIIQKHVDPDVFEQTAGIFVSEAYEVYGEAIVDHSVAGSMPEKRSLGSDPRNRV